MKRMKCAIYARVSTDKQKDSLDTQLLRLKEFCISKNYNVIVTYSEIISGRNKNRKEFTRLMDDVGNKKIDCVVVQKFDRFTRGMLDLLNNLAYLESNGASLVSMDENIDIQTSEGKFMFCMLGVFSDFESSRIIERTKIGIDRAKQNGNECHRPRKNIDIDHVKTLYSNGMSLRDIASTENVSYSTLHNRLRSEGIKLKTTLIHTSGRQSYLGDE